MMEAWLSSVCEELDQRGTLSISYHCLWSTLMSLQTPPFPFLSSVSSFWDAVLEADLLLDQGLWCKTEQPLKELYETPSFDLRKRCLFIRWSRYFILATVIIIRVLYFYLSRSSNVVGWGLFNLQRGSSASLSVALLPQPSSSSALSVLMSPSLPDSLMSSVNSAVVTQEFSLSRYFYDASDKEWLSTKIWNQAQAYVWLTGHRWSHDPGTMTGVLVQALQRGVGSVNRQKLLSDGPGWLTPF